MLDVVGVAKLLSRRNARADFLSIQAQQSWDSQNDAGRDKEPNKRVEERIALKDLVDGSPGANTLKGGEEDRRLGCGESDSILALQRETCHL